ncbi:Glutamyl-tRNA reductase [Neochlamydia sp. AcF65]|uniref:glutamyl-tRNA reductase n=1 Tax=Neochlamydia sp. AcF65 TaxID=2795735 RepID=UPI001BC92337|nr:glutamyl-tRNA reductase [Neochlamydia sp. AcF65]MBS4166488.1 Glutamyl-tRNA reductase [Neochlamydia sp. AcF65]
MRIGVLGINYKLADLKLRELLAKACQKRLGAGISMHGHHHFILLSTCNRTEIYFCSDDLADTHTYLLNIFRNEVDTQFDQKLYSYFGHDCFYHLSRVTAGLDSAIVAETEIQSQVKHAYKISCQFSQLPEEMHYLFQKSLKIAKKIRSQHLLTRTLPDIEHAIFNTGSHFFKNLSQVKILLVGASAINQKILRFLLSKNFSDITICNRTKKHAIDLARTYQLNLLDWQSLTQWHQFDWIICGTKAPQTVINYSHLPLKEIPAKLLIDLGVPRNIDPSVARHTQITLLNIDQINRMLTFRKQKLYEHLTKADQGIIEATKQHIHLFKQKQTYREQLLAVGMGA